MAAITIPGATLTYTRRWDGEAARFQALQQLEWEEREGVPRAEYFCSQVGQPYAYGVGPGRRTYLPREVTPLLSAIWEEVAAAAGVRFDVCFLNYYRGSSDALGWHADDSPEMDDARPIAVLSYGSPRTLHFRRRGEKKSEATVEMNTGDLLIMPPGFQDTHDHRVAKSSFQNSSRISLTFRGYVDPGS